ncbi:MAG: hypothetical protein ACI9QC_000363 [Oceanicoccus sp.]|jgi:hypothetical protein
MNTRRGLGLGGALVAGLLAGEPALGQEIEPSTLDVTELSDDELLETSVKISGIFSSEEEGRDGYDPHIFYGVGGVPYFRTSKARGGETHKTIYYEARDETAVVCIGVSYLNQDIDGSWTIDSSNHKISAPYPCSEFPDRFPTAVFHPIVASVPNAQYTTEPSQTPWSDGISLSANVGPYVEEYDMYTKGVNPDFRLESLVPLGDSQWGLGVTSQLLVPVGDMERSGLGRSGLVVAREFEVPRLEKGLTVSAQAGYSRDYNPLLNSPYVLLGGSMEVLPIDAINGSLVTNLYVSHDFIGNGWFLAGDPGLSAGAGVGLLVYPAAYFDRDQAPRVEEVEAMIAVIPEDTGQEEDTGEIGIDGVEIVERSKGFDRKAHEGIPEFNYEHGVSQTVNKPEVEAEMIRLLDGISQYLRNNNYIGAYRSFVMAAELSEKSGESLTADLLGFGYFAGIQEGKGVLAYECLKKLEPVPETTWRTVLADFEKRFGWVHLSGKSLELSGMTPFEADSRAQIEEVQEILAEEGEYHGLLPALEYTLDGVTFTPESIDDGDRVTVVKGN